MIKLKDIISEAAIENETNLNFKIYGIRNNDLIIEGRKLKITLSFKGDDLTDAVNGKYIKIVFSSFSDENRIKVFMTVKMGYKYVTWQRNPNRLWFK